MGIGYELVCVDCKRSLGMGKIYWQDESGAPLESTTFDGVFNRATRQWHKRDEFFGRTIEAFLIQHRNHEIRFVPEGVDELIETGDEIVELLDPDEIIAAQNAVFPDPDQDLKEWEHKYRGPR
ncbi:hypothetical protein WMF39_34715 [Sorangium sp. So ce1504]|uniref:hypothetical protein n=1 Tax=Sorangium sp. So ce1504 TaxID=3133337 RepID=UPI003F5F74DA